MKRTLSLLLTLAMVLALVPATVLATDETQPTNVLLTAYGSEDAPEYMVMYWSAPYSEAYELVYSEVEIYWSAEEYGEYQLIATESTSDSDFWLYDCSSPVDVTNIIRHGEGWYKFRVRCGVTSGEYGEWAWCAAPYHYVPDDTLPSIAAPTNLSIDNTNGDLTWDYDPLTQVVIHVMYAGDGSEEYQQVATVLGWSGADNANELLQHLEAPSGLYQFNLQAYSSSNYLSTSPSLTNAFPNAFWYNGVPQLAAPADLQWHYGLDGDGELSYAPGSIAFSQVEGADGYYIALYEVDASTGEGTRVSADTSYTYGNSYCTADISDALEVGKSYYFTVQATADGVSAMTSEPAVSDTWTCTQPEVQLTTTAPYWSLEARTMHWTTNAPELVDRYQFRFYYSAVPVEDFALEDYFEGDYHMGDWTDDPEISSYVLEQNGTGYYYFRVRAVTSDILAATTGEWSELSDALYYQVPTNKAPAATDLQWGLNRFYDGNVYQPGCISFAGDNDTEYQVYLYRQGGEYPVDGRTLYCEDGWGNLNPFENYPEIALTGTYYFTVQALGDGVDTADGDIITSPTWDYVRPEAVLTPTDLAWGADDLSLTWTVDESLVSQYRTAFYFSPDVDSAAAASWCGSRYYYPGSEPFTVPLDIFTQNGDGWYYFSVRTVSNDPTQALSSDWTELSPGFRYTTPDQVLTVSDPVWDGLSLTWSESFTDRSLVDYYNVELYYTADNVTPTGEDQICWLTYQPDELPVALPSWVLEEHGQGYYWFEVQATTANPLAAVTGEYSAMSPAMYFDGPTGTAPAPYDLQWHVQRWNVGDNMDAPGTVSFGGTVTSGDYTKYQVDIYRQEASGDVLIGTQWATLWNGDDYANVYPYAAFPDAFITGAYYFTVTPIGDGVTTKDGEPVKSPVWDYVRPETQLTVSGPVWNDNMSMSWTAGENSDLVNHYEVELSFSASSTSVEDAQSRSQSTYKPGELALPNPNSLENNGNGYYFFRVRAVTSDINTAVTSEWTEWSTAFQYTDPGVQLAMSNLAWDEANTAVTWDLNVDESLVDYYQVRYYYSETNVRPEYQDSTIFYYPGQEPFTIPSWQLEGNGPGYYWFSVRAYSADPTQVSTNSTYSAVSPALYFDGPGTQLGTPSDLQWHVEHDWDNSTLQRMGSASFKRADPDQARYHVWFYRVGESEPVAKHSWSFGSTNTRTHFDVSSFIYEDLPSGEYYFTVRAQGDMINYSHGEWSEPSPVWSYTTPSARLSVPTGLTWDDTLNENEVNMLWDAVDNAGYYETELFYSPTENGPKESVGGNFDMNEPINILWEDVIAEHGNGWYFFQVRAIPADITQYRVSDWSDYSPGYNLSDLTTQVNDQLDAIDTTTATTQEVQQAVAQIEDLNLALAADTTNSDTVAKIAELESTMGDTAIDTGNAPAGFDTEGVTVTGAVLNAGDDATLTISKVDETAPPAALNPAQYNNTITFAMDIPQAKDTSNEEGLQLAVPVKITLPIPGNINPAFLVVLHYKQSTNTWEELMWPHVYQEGGKWYATFVVDSMSPFALGERQMEVTKVPGGLEVEAHLPTVGSKATQLMCAVYSEQGQMLGMTMLDPHAEEPVFMELSDVSKAAYLKVFSTASGNGWMPLSDAQTIEIQ